MSQFSTHSRKGLKFALGAFVLAAALFGVWVRLLHSDTGFFGQVMVGIILALSLSLFLLSFVLLWAVLSRKPVRTVSKNYSNLNSIEIMYRVPFLSILVFSSATIGSILLASGNRENTGPVITAFAILAILSAVVFAIRLYSSIPCLRISRIGVEYTGLFFERRKLKWEGPRSERVSRIHLNPDASYIMQLLMVYDGNGKRKIRIGHSIIQASHYDLSRIFEEFAPPLIRIDGSLFDAT